MCIEQEEWNAAEMIAVEMRDQDRFDGIAVNTAAFKGGQRRGSAIDQSIGLPADKVQAGIISPAGAESIAAADELQMHAISPRAAQKRAIRGETSLPQRR